VRLVAAGQDERVAGGQRERVWKGGAELVLDGEVSGREAVAENAGHGVTISLRRGDLSGPRPAHVVPAGPWAKADRATEGRMKAAKTPERCSPAYRARTWKLSA